MKFMLPGVGEVRLSTNAILDTARENTRILQQYLGGSIDLKWSEVQLRVGVLRSCAKADNKRRGRIIKDLLLRRQLITTLGAVAIRAKQLGGHRNGLWALLPAELHEFQARTEALTRKAEKKKQGK